VAEAAFCCTEKCREHTPGKCRTGDRTPVGAVPAAPLTSELHARSRICNDVLMILANPGGIASL
jgi:hypothetical protein